MTAKKYPVVKGETVEGGSVQREISVFSGMISAGGEGDEVARKGENEGEGEKKTRCKNRMRRREMYRTGIGKRGR